MRLVPAPSHTPGSQLVVVAGEGDAGPTVLAGDNVVFHTDLDEPQTDAQRLIRALNPEVVWYAHSAEPWRLGHG